MIPLVKYMSFWVLAGKRGALKMGEGGFSEGTIYSIQGEVSIRQQCSRASHSDRPVLSLER